MKKPSAKTVITLCITIIGMAVLAASAQVMRRIVLQDNEETSVSLPTIPTSTLDEIRSREQTVQDINFDQVPAGVHRNPFTPYSGSTATTTSTTVTASTTVTETGAEPLPEPPGSVASPATSGMTQLDPNAAY